MRSEPFSNRYLLLGPLKLKLPAAAGTALAVVVRLDGLCHGSKFCIIVK